MTLTSPRGARIVVTDDDPMLMSFVVTTLRSAGHCVFAAYDAGSACELALVIPDVDLLVTNTRIGTVTNRDLIRQIRNDKPGMPILHIGPPMPDPDGLLSDVPSLPEPFTADQLLAQVRRLVRRNTPDATGPS